MPITEHDYVIVGAGSAGCTLANRLSAADGARVLLVEAGGWDRDPWLQVPLAWGRMLLRRMHDWQYFAEPEASMDGRRVECARGKVVGGSSSINAMCYVRGNRADYDRWAAQGLPHWSYAHVLPYFRRQESWQGGAGPYRGGDGPLTTQYTRLEEPIVEAYAAAGAAAGHPATADYNGAEQEGFAPLQMTIRGGQRCSAAVAYLRPALARRNLEVVAGALATRIILENQRAVGVEYRRRGETHIARAGTAVILTGGVINTPQLLMLSGIGDPDELARHGIAAQAALKGVGRNLQDHISVAHGNARSAPGPIHRGLRLDRAALGLAKVWLGGGGVMADVFGGVMAFLKTGRAALPDVQLLFNAAPMNAHPYLAPFRAPYADGFGSRVVLLRPESRGRIGLASADPAAAPLIHQNFLATDNDRATLRAGFRMLRDVMRQAPMRPFDAGELFPGAACESDAEIDAHIRATAITVHHPLGTCRMGGEGDAMAVLDGELRVRGVAGLRVADASAMPDLVGGNINAPVIMLAEKAADLILGRAPPAPVNV